MLSDYEIGDRVYVRWYGGTDMPCVVSGETTVQREERYGEGNGKDLRVGEKDIVEDPKPWGVTVQKKIDRKRNRRKGW